MKETEKNSIWKFARENKIEEKLREIGKDLALQGEMVGEGIQKNTLKIKGLKVLFFNVYDIKNAKYLNFTEFKEIIKRLKLEMVPIILEDFVLINNIEELVRFATGKSLIAPEIWREGIVIRPLQEIQDYEVAEDGRISFKVINPEYLLKYEE